MIHKQEQNTTKTFVTAFVLCVCFLAVSFSILFLMLQKSEAEGVQYLRDNAAQSQIALQRQMRGDFQTLDGIAVCLTGAAALDDEILPGLLETINNGNAFIRMGMASPEGKVDLVDLEGNWISDIDISFREFFQKSMRGENAISETIKDSYGEGFINYYGVPVQKDGRIIGVLCAVNSSDSFREIVDVSVFNGQGFTNIVDGEGKLVIRATTGMMQSSEAVSLWELGEFTEEERASARGILSSGAQGELSYRCENEDMLAVLEPIGVNDWFVMSAVPRSAIRQNYSQTLLAMGIIIVAALLIFLSLLQHQRRMMSKNRNALLHLAYDDPLTGCANFSRFLLEGERLLEENRQLGRRCAVWYCDLKKFKYYNDLFGYRAGDQLLMRLAGIFDQNKPEHSTFCRVSGDNFVGLYCYHSRAELENRFAKLIRQLSDAEERASALELCMGVYFVEEGMLTLNDMVDRANMAQKSVKDKPGSQLAFFTRQIRERSLFESEIQALGEKALAAGEFLLYLQPKVDIQNGDRVVGAEVLARWNSPSHGMIPPGEFIPLFEKSGLIVQLDRYMLRQACQWLAGRLSDGERPVNFAVNVSRLGLLQEDFVRYYASVKREYSIPDGVIELEFTESMALGDVELFRRTVLNLQKEGFICSLDDFGAGYSSLNMLKMLPIDVLKLDILFFRQGVDVHRERVVVASVLAMARELKIKTIAEGVEESDQVEFLRGAGCDVVQGFIFSRPLPEHEFDDLLKDLAGGPIPMKKQ